MRTAARHRGARAVAGLAAHTARRRHPRHHLRAASAVAASPRRVGVGGGLGLGLALVVLALAHGTELHRVLQLARQRAVRLDRAAAQLARAKRRESCRLAPLLGAGDELAQHAEAVGLQVARVEAQVERLLLQPHRDVVLGVVRAEDRDVVRARERVARVVGRDGHDVVAHAAPARALPRVLVLVRRARLVRDEEVGVAGDRLERKDDHLALAQLERVVRVLELADALLHERHVGDQLLRHRRHGVLRLLCLMRQHDLGLAVLRRHARLLAQLHATGREVERLAERLEGLLARRGPAAPVALRLALELALLVLVAVGQRLDAVLRAAMRRAELERRIHEVSHRVGRLLADVPAAGARVRVAQPTRARDLLEARRPLLLLLHWECARRISRAGTGVATPQI